jgi:hypothetical protein
MKTTTSTTTTDRTTLYHDRIVYPSD